MKFCRSKICRLLPTSIRLLDDACCRWVGICNCGFQELNILGSRWCLVHTILAVPRWTLAVASPTVVAAARCPFLTEASQQDS